MFAIVFTFLVPFSLSLCFPFSDTLLHLASRWRRQSSRPELLLIIDGLVESGAISEQVAEVLDMLAYTEDHVLIAAFENYLDSREDR